ncbi:YopX family protein [Bacillus subtilis]|uniref:YopX family protein n=1 Tax=Bacillus subtilis TaxID=1423 RepID=UPI00234BBE4F|nr:YopX family protein [Bacillus subtilis]WCL64262.1 YopX family protein [Bacillus subtilis]
MREIKFRAWNKEKSIMVYEDEDNSSAYWDGVCLSDIEMINARLKYSSTYIWMQYTGLRDRNDREIYEGDILETTCELYTNFGKTPTGRFHTSYVKVIWIDEGWGYEVINNNGKGLINGYKTQGLKTTAKYSLVYGNIYEDPELLEASHASK